MFLPKKPDGFYYIVFQNIEGKRSSISTKTKIKLDANYHLRQSIKKYIEGTTNPIIPITLNQL